MVSTSALLGIALVELALVLIPGPNMVYLVSRPITQGRRTGFVSLLSVAAGFLVYLATATAGLAAVFAVVPVAYTVLKLPGAVYLLHLAWQALRPGVSSAFAPRELVHRPDRRGVPRAAGPMTRSPRSARALAAAQRSVRLDNVF